MVKQKLFLTFKIVKKTPSSAAKQLSEKRLTAASSTPQGKFPNELNSQKYSSRTLEFTKNSIDYSTLQNENIESYTQPKKQQKCQQQQQLLHSQRLALKPVQTHVYNVDKSRRSSLQDECQIDSDYVPYDAESESSMTVLMR
jgi:hypothetical protein